MHKLSIKPLSLNHAYRGRRFSTPTLKKFKMDMAKILPKLTVPMEKLSVRYEFGVSTKNCDGDNLIKATQDSLAECYGFNDRLVYEWQVRKVLVPKGEEYIAFEISSYPQSP